MTIVSDEDWDRCMREGAPAVDRVIEYCRAKGLDAEHGPVVECPTRKAGKTDKGDIWLDGGERRIEVKRQHHWKDDRPMWEKGGSFESPMIDACYKADREDVPPLAAYAIVNYPMRVFFWVPASTREHWYVHENPYDQYAVGGQKAIYRISYVHLTKYFRRF